MAYIADLSVCVLILFDNVCVYYNSDTQLTIYTAYFQFFSFEDFFIYLYTLTSLSFLTDNPSPPHELHHDALANTESSAVIQWQSPLYTGGPIIRYTVTANGQTESVSGNVFTYTITGLDVNTNYSVEVTAVNSCGLESEPANVTVNIEARGK